MRKKYKWTPEIDEFLIKNYAKLGCKECSRILNIPYRAVQGRALKKLRVSKFKHLEWTDSLITFLKENYPKYGGRYVSDNTGIPITSVNKKANELKVYYKPKDRYVCSEGYIVVGKVGHRKAEHRAVMESILGRELSSNEIVHHKDRNKLNNDPSNLEVVTRSEHIQIHRKDLKSS